MPTVTADRQIREQLDQLRTQLADLRQRRTEAKKEQDAAKEALGPLLAQGKKLTDLPEFAAAEEAVKKVAWLTDEIDNHRENETSLLKLLGESADSNGNGHAGDTVSAVLRVPPGGWNAASMLHASETYQDARDRGVFTSKNKFGSLELGQLASRDQTANFLRSRSVKAEEPGTVSLPTATPGPVTSATHPQLLGTDDRGVVPFRLPTLLDIFPTGTTDAPVVEYVQVIAIPGSAAVVAEGAAKPQEGITFRDESANVVTIAGWIKVNRQAMADMAGLSAMINTLLPYDVRRQAQAQILLGTGTAGQIRGIYNTTGVGVGPAPEADDNIADAFLRAMTVVIMSDGEPNFAALNPLTWQDLLLMKNANGNYLYGAPGTLPGGMVSQTVWGLTLTTNRAIPQAQPLVGDSMGAMILVREGVNVRGSDSDQDDFIRNRVTILAETRIAFPVWRPTDFCKVTLPSAAGDEE